MESYKEGNFNEINSQRLTKELEKSGITEYEFILLTSILDFKQDYLEIIKKHSGGQNFNFIEEDKYINPFWHQTTGGIAVEFYGFFGDFIKSIWTPWGKIDVILGGGEPKNIDKAKAEIINTYKLQFLSPYNNSTEVGVLYQLNELNGIKLPSYQEKSREDFKNHNEIYSKWEKLNEIKSLVK